MADEFVVNQIFQRFAWRLLQRLLVLRQLILIILNERRHCGIIGVELLKRFLNAVHAREDSLRVETRARLIIAHFKRDAVDGGDSFVLHGNDDAPIADGEDDNNEGGDDAKRDKEDALLFLIALAHARLFARFIWKRILFGHS
ncbi:MAG: hypothetical protein B6D41_12855 [Chloroflexi bacterium UTCFX4]|nr:MAG: hypothetical protein B6D41_12855 [Chloroflexi bacterium UTCFX4]